MIYYDDHDISLMIMMIIVISAGAHLHMLSDEWWGAQGGVGEEGRCDSESYWIIIIYIYIYIIFHYNDLSGNHRRYLI